MRKRSTFIFFIATITATVITLFQLYWVFGSYKTAENNFHRMVANTLEKSVVLYQLKQKQPGDTINLPVLTHVFKHELSKSSIDIPFKLVVLQHWGKIDSAEIAVLTDFLKEPVVIEARFANERELLITQNIGPVIFSLILILLSTGSLFYMGYIIRRLLLLDNRKNDFINNIIHELRTPVSILKSSTEALTHFGASDDPARSARYLQINATILDKLEDNLERMLDITRFEQGNKVAQFETINLYELIAGLVQVYSLKANIIIALDYDLPHQSLRTDRYLIETILANLLDNAIKYGRGQLIIRVAVTTVDQGWQLQVTDNGRGIEKNNLPFIFDKFYRVQTGDLHETKGYGLGLSYVKQLVKALNGHIYVESKIGKGTTFTIKFPFQHGQD